MFCFRYKKLLMPYAEGALSSSQSNRLERHLDSCPSCKSELAAITVTVQALRRTDIPAMEPAEDLWGRIRQELRQPAVRKPVWHVRSFQAASAATVSAVLLLFVLSRSTYYGPGQMETAEEPTKMAARVESKAPRPSGIKQPKEVFVDGHVKLRKLPIATDKSIGKRVSRYNDKLPQQPPSPADSYLDSKGAMKPAVGFYSPPLASSGAGADKGQAQDYKTTFYYEGQTKSEPGSFAAAAPAPGSPAPIDKVDADKAEGSKPQDSMRAKQENNLTLIGGLSKECEDAAKPEAVSGDYKSNPLAQLRVDYMQQLEKHPDDTATIVRLASLEMRLKDFPAAIKWRIRLAELRPNDASNWAELGKAYDKNSQPAEAIAAYKKALRAGLPTYSADVIKKRVRDLEPSSRQDHKK